MSRNLIDEVEQKIFNKISRKKYILIGECHGAKENVKIANTLVTFFVKNPFLKIAFAFEWHVSRNDESILKKYVSNESVNDKKYRGVLKHLAENKSGVFSDQHADFLSKLRETNQTFSKKHKIGLFCFDLSGKSWNDRDKRMAGKIESQEKKFDMIFIFTGNIHARKKKILPENDKNYLAPLGSLLPRKKTFSVKIEYLEGSIFNYGVKKLFKVSGGRKISVDTAYDNFIIIHKATPITLTRCFEPQSDCLI